MRENLLHGAPRVGVAAGSVLVVVFRHRQVPRDVRDGRRWWPCLIARRLHRPAAPPAGTAWPSASRGGRSEEHTSELQSLMRISYAVFCLKKKIINNTHKQTLDKPL